MNKNSKKGEINELLCLSDEGVTTLSEEKSLTSTYKCVELPIDTPRSSECHSHREPVQQASGSPKTHELYKKQLYRVAVPGFNRFMTPEARVTVKDIMLHQRFSTTFSLSFFTQRPSVSFQASGGTGSVWVGAGIYSQMRPITGYFLSNYIYGGRKLWILFNLKV